MTEVHNIEKLQKTKMFSTAQHQVLQTSGICGNIMDKQVIL